MPTVVRRQCVRCKRNRATKFFTPRGRVCVTCRRNTRKRTTRVARLTATYGLQPGEYEQLLAAQGGVCAICQQPRTRNLDVDHDHKAEATVGVRRAIRGLLCARCNRHLLARGSSDPAVLRRAADYLENPPAHQVLED